MKSRFTTILLVLGLAVFGAGAAFAASAHIGLAKGHHHGKNHAKHHAKTKHHRSHHTTTVTQPTSDTNGSGDNGDDAAGNQYGTRPGKGCGDRNHVHTGPPGNPSNTACPPQSQHGQTTGTTGTTTPTPTAKLKHHARHHSRTKHGHKFGKNHKH